MTATAGVPAARVNDDDRLARVIGATRVRREVAVLPYLELRYIAATELTGAAAVAIHTGPATMRPATSDPARLRLMAAMLEEAARWLEAERARPADPGDTPTILDAIAALEAEEAPT